LNNIRIYQFFSNLNLNIKSEKIMSDDKRIEKNEKKVIQEIEQICGPLKRVNMTGYTTVENLFNFDDDGKIIMLGFDFQTLNLDDTKLNLLGESVKKLRNIERFILNCPKDKGVPTWLRELNFIKELVLVDSQLTSIPEDIKELKNLNYLYLTKNNISNLPEWLTTLDKLETLYLNEKNQTLEITQSNIDILKTLSEKNVRINDPTNNLALRLGVPLDQIKIIREIKNEDGLNRVVGNKIDTLGDSYIMNKWVIDVRVLDGKIAHLIMHGYNTAELPDNFGKLDGLTRLILFENQLESLPKSFGDLKYLEELDLSKNQLESLPESFVNLTSLQKLDLSNNQFKEIPTQLWALKELIQLNLTGNPLSTEENTIIQKVPDLIREYLREKATIRVFISHAVIDYGPYRIGDLVEFLERQKEISQVFFCEEDLAGNIDQWMLDAVQKCQLILFIATNKSVFNSADCANELQLADKFSIPVIPLKGKDVDWPDLAERNLSRELGLEYDTENFDAFCEDLYKYIENFKREINLMQKEERRLGIIDIYERFRLMLDETLSDVKRKLDALGERITQLEKKLN